ncbi:hypothetical protein KAI65_04200 [Candidatus Parcubacteria bacterium]|nr:hypothetical protein [Candidatus Parcubacteria bacterium]
MQKLKTKNTKCIPRVPHRKCPWGAFPAGHPLGKIIFLTAVFLAFFIFTPFVLTVAADGAGDALTGLNTAANKGYGVSDVNADGSGVMNSLPGAIGKVVGVILSLIGVVFLILMIYGGFTWMIARGNEQEVTKSKELIKSAIVGLIIVLAAYAITAYIGSKMF